MSQQDRKRLVELARNRGFSNEEILRKIIMGSGGDERRQRIVEWAEALGILPSEALQLARAASLIPSTHPPRAAAATAMAAAEPLPRKTQESTDE